MSDLALAAGWLAVLVFGFAGCLVLRAMGLASTYVRDLLHVGAGVWVLGWPWWRTPALPIAIVAAVAIAVAALPIVAARFRLAARLERSVTGGDERWGGLVLYTIAYTALTAIGLLGEPFPAAAGLLALSLGDGIGGAVGRAVGRHRFTAAGGKPKSLEGSLVVALGAVAGGAIAAHLFAAPVGAGVLAVLGVVAALAEGAAPRGTDNLLVPLAVWAVAQLVT